MPSKENRATAIGNMHKKFGEIRLCSFWVTWADRQTDRQTDVRTYWLQ